MRGEKLIKKSFSIKTLKIIYSFLSCSLNKILLIMMPEEGQWEKINLVVRKIHHVSLDFVGIWKKKSFSIESFREGILIDEIFPKKIYKGTFNFITFSKLKKKIQLSSWRISNFIILISLPDNVSPNFVFQLWQTCFYLIKNYLFYRLLYKKGISALKLCDLVFW